MRLRYFLLLAVFCAGAVCAQSVDDSAGFPADPSLETPSESDQAPRAEGTAIGGSSAGSMEVAAHLWAVIGRYRFAATADRIRVTLIQPGGRSDMHSLVIRCVPGSAGLVRLELGDLILVARQGVLHAVHREDPTTFVEMRTSDPLTGPAGVVRELLPVLALPQLSLAFDRAEVDWCPLVSGLEWGSAERMMIDGEGGVRLRGRTSQGEAMLDLATARVRRFEADLDAEGTRIMIECEPVETGDPSGWVLDVAGRRAIDRLSGLRPLGRVIGIGEKLPRLGVMSVDTQVEGVLGGEPETGLSGRMQLHALLLLRDDAPAAETRAIVSTVLAGMTKCRRDLLRGRIAGRYTKRVQLVDLTGVIQAETSGGILARIQTQADAWRDAVTSTLPAESVKPELCWQAESTRLIDRFSPGAHAVLVMHDGGGVIRSILPLRADTPSAMVGDALLSGVPLGRE